MIGNSYSAWVEPISALVKFCLAYDIPGTHLKLIFVLHALRLSLAYHATAPLGLSWVQGMLSVCAMPISSGVVAAVLTSTVPPFLLGDGVLPTYMLTFLAVRLAISVFEPSRMQKQRLASTVSYITIPADAILKCSNLCTAGVDALKTHPLAPLRTALFAPVFVGGTIGCAGYMAMHTLGLSSTWQFSSAALNAPLGLEWEVWGPYALSLLYIALQGTDARVNKAAQLLSRGILTNKTRFFFSKEEARTLVIWTQTAIQFIKASGVWLGRLPFTARRDDPTRKAQ